MVIMLLKEKLGNLAVHAFEFLLFFVLFLFLLYLVVFFCFFFCACPIIYITTVVRLTYSEGGKYEREEVENDDTNLENRFDFSSLGD